MLALLSMLVLVTGGFCIPCFCSQVQFIKDDTVSQPLYYKKIAMAVMQNVLHIPILSVELNISFQESQFYLLKCNPTQKARPGSHLFQDAWDQLFCNFLLHPICFALSFPSAGTQAFEIFKNTQASQLTFLGSCSFMQSKLPLIL